MNALTPKRGDVWWVALDPVIGREQGGHKLHEPRPAVVVSDDRINSGVSEMIVIVPMTGTVRANPFHVLIDPPDGGLSKQSMALCDQVRAISTLRVKNQMGVVHIRTLALIDLRLRSVLRLPTQSMSSRS